MIMQEQVKLLCRQSRRYSPIPYIIISMTGGILYDMISIIHIIFSGPKPNITNLPTTVILHMAHDIDVDHLIYTVKYTDDSVGDTMTTSLSISPTSTDFTDTHFTDTSSGTSK